MGLAQLFGLDTAGQKSVQEAHVAINEALDKVSPILDNLFNRLTILAHTLLNRFKVSVHFEITEWNPPPKDSKQY